MKKVLLIIAFIFTANAANAIDVTIENPKIRLMPPGANMTAGYFTIINNSDEDITLVGVSSSKYDSMEIHDTVKDGDVMKMVKQNSVTIGANSKFEFRPMSYHLMFMMPEEDFKENQEIDVTFITKSGDEFSSVFTVKKMTAMKMKMDMGDMGHMMKNMARPDYVFPAGIKGGKNMMSKKLMFGYKYGTMEMDCCKDSTSSVSNDFIKNLGFSMAPTDMTMDMHMFSAMYAVNNKISLMAMISYIEKEMEMVKLSGMNVGNTHKTSSRGMGDLSIAGLYKLSGKSNLKAFYQFPQVNMMKKIII